VSQFTLLYVIDQILPAPS